jgi:hypothetical protein
MAFTMQQVVDRGRDPLNDSDKDRYSDPDLLSFSIDALLTIKAKRPDLLIGNWSVDFTTLTLGSAFPLGDILAPAVAEYVTARAECRDDEHVVTQRATQFFQLFASRI